MTGRIAPKPVSPQVVVQPAKLERAATPEVKSSGAESAFGGQARAAERPNPNAPVPKSASTDALWSAKPVADPAKVASISAAMATQSESELAKTIASASKESPKAYRAALRDTLEGHLKDASKLQRHLTLLDLDGDGEVSMKENYKSLRQLGMSAVKSVLVGGASQLALVLTTRDSFGTSIPIKNGDKGQHKTVHTGGMDPEQELSAKLDEMMAEDVNGDGYLELSEISSLLDKRAAASDSSKIAKTLIKAANKGEFAMLFELVGGKMNRDDLKDFYMGSLFFSLLPPEALAQRLVLLREKS